MRARRILALAILLVLASACSGQLPRPVIERSPLMQPAPRLYIPFVQHRQTKLGVGGCPATCAELGCSWCYDWSSQPGLPPGVEAVPMIYAASEVYAPVRGNSRWVMEFNEPDRSDQANLAAQNCVAPLRAIEARFPDRKLVAPAPSDGDLGWLVRCREQFVRETGRPPRWDALALHCYRNSVALCGELLQQVLGWADAWDVPEIWVTEFFFSNESQAQAWVDLLYRTPRVTRYAPFASYVPCESSAAYWDCQKGGDPSLLEADGVTLTEMGRWYARPAEDSE